LVDLRCRPVQIVAAWRGRLIFSFSINAGPQSGEPEVRFALLNNIEISIVFDAERTGGAKMLHAQN
jgi:hypothetical protein